MALFNRNTTVGKFLNKNTKVVVGGLSAGLNMVSPGLGTKVSAAVLSADAARKEKQRLEALSVAEASTRYLPGAAASVSSKISPVMIIGGLVVVVLVFFGFKKFSRR